MPVKTKPRHKRPTPSRARQGMALGVTTVVSAGAVVAGAGVAEAADKPVSQSTGVFLSGSALGVNLDDIVELVSAAASNTGGPATVSELNPLGVTLLNSLNVPLGFGLNLLQGNGLLTLGAVNQAAIARPNGSAIGASGAVADSGAIAVAGNDGVPASTAKLDLGGLLGTGLGNGLTDGLIDVDLNVGAISANATQAKGENGKQVGDYRIADLDLTLRSPLLAGLLGGLNLTDEQSQIAGLDGVLNALDLDTLLGPVLALLGLTNPELNADNLPVLADIVAAQDTSLGSGAVTVDLSNGKITVDVEALLKSLGLDLNNLPPNTELVRLILNAVADRVGDLVGDAVQDLADDITAAIEGTTVTGQGTNLITAAIEPITDLSAVTDEIDAILANLLDDVLAPVSALLSDVAGTLLDPLFDALEELLSIRVNVQNQNGDTFTQRAIQVRILPDGAGVTTAAVNDTLATVNLASATVGPGSGQVAREEDDEDDANDNGNPLPDTGAAESAPLAAAGLALMLAGAAATAGANRMGNGPTGAHAGPRGRGSGGGGRHARR